MINSSSKRATNFGLDINTMAGPTTFEDLSDSERQGHELISVSAHQLVSKGSQELMLAMMALKAQAEKDHLEVDDDSYTWRIRKPLTNAELTRKLREAQKEWQEGLEQYLWIAADISNAQDEDARYKAEGRKARVFQEISKRLGYKVTDFWKFEYNVMEGFEYAPDNRTLTNNYNTNQPRVIDAEII